MSGHAAHASGVGDKVFLIGSTDFIPFYNIEPRNRLTRRAQTDKETLEKQRLKQRTGGFHTYDENQKIIGFDKGAPGWQPEAQRFDTDSCGEEHRRRLAKYRTREAIDQKKREVVTQREQQRWEDIDESNRVAEQQWEKYRENATFTKKNIESVPYDPITLGYNDGADGDRLRHEDATIKYRAALRAKRLRDKDVGEGYNPITGSMLEQLQMPPAPGPVPSF